MVASHSLIERLLNNIGASQLYVYESNLNFSIGTESFKRAYLWVLMAGQTACDPFEPANVDIYFKSHLEYHKKGQYKCQRNKQRQSKLLYSWFRLYSRMSMNRF